MEESNVQPVLSPVTIVGDLHGQFYDLLQLLSPEVGGEPPSSSFVFLGDFVDRGHNSVETLSLLLCLKMKYPGHVTLLRGNHEVSMYLRSLLSKVAQISHLDRQIFLHMHHYHSSSQIVVAILPIVFALVESTNNPSVWIL